MSAKVNAQRNVIQGENAFPTPKRTKFQSLKVALRALTTPNALADKRKLFLPADVKVKDLACRYPMFYEGTNEQVTKASAYADKHSKIAKAIKYIATPIKFKEKDADLDAVKPSKLKLVVGIVKDTMGKKGIEIADRISSKIASLIFSASDLFGVAGNVVAIPVAAAVNGLVTVLLTPATAIYAGLRCGFETLKVKHEMAQKKHVSFAVPVAQ